jgi:UDP-N-acetylglucosamine 4,6-dehydratase/5-epimerase
VQNIAITGGTGSLGFELTKRLLEQGKYVTVISRDAHKQAAMMGRLKSNSVNYVLCDICSKDAIARALDGHDTVIHTAALKRIERGISDVAEYTRVNVYGTETVANAASSVGVDKALFISTDKCAAPLQVYGKTKAIAESIWLSNDSATSSFSAVRYGNVMDSNGGVWQIWNQLLAEGKPIMVRVPEPTRFFMTLQDAVDLVMTALDNMIGGEIIVPSYLPAFSMFDLARYACADDSKWITMPLLPGEKQHEILVAPGEFVSRVGDSSISVILQSTGDRQFSTIDEFDSERTTNRLSAKEVVWRLTNER